MVFTPPSKKLRDYPKVESGRKKVGSRGTIPESCPRPPFERRLQGHEIGASNNAHGARCEALNMAAIV